MSVVAVRPIIERIAQELLRRLQLLQSDYDPQIHVVEVIRPQNRDYATPQHGQILLTLGSREPIPELMCPGNPPKVAIGQTFNIRCHLRPSEADPTPIDEYVFVIEAAVIKAVTDESALTYAWHTFENLSVNAEFQPRENIDSDGGVDGVNVPLVVTYRTNENNPYTTEQQDPTAVDGQYLRPDVHSFYDRPSGGRYIRP